MATASDKFNKNGGAGARILPILAYFELLYFTTKWTNVNKTLYD